MKIAMRLGMNLKISEEDVGNREKVFEKEDENHEEDVNCVDVEEKICKDFEAQFGEATRDDDVTNANSGDDMVRMKLEGLCEIVKKKTKKKIM